MIKGSRFAGVWLACMLVCACVVQSKAAEMTAGRWAIGYDEGIGGRYYVVDAFSVHGALDYRVTGADTVGRQPINTIALKLGGGYALLMNESVALSLFGEWRQELNQMETAQRVPQSGTNVDATMRYNQWNTIFRLGVRPEVFITDQFSIDYRAGVEFIMHGTEYELNATNDDTRSKENDFLEFGIYRARDLLMGEMNPMLAIGINYYLN